MCSISFVTFSLLEHNNSQDTLTINFNVSVTKVMQEKNEKDCRYPNRFKVTDGINGQFFDISADSPAQMNEWVDAINLVSYNTSCVCMCVCL